MLDLIIYPRSLVYERKKKGEVYIDKKIKEKQISFSYLTAKCDEINFFVVISSSFYDNSLKKGDKKNISHTERIKPSIVFTFVRKKGGFRTSHLKIASVKNQFWYSSYSYRDVFP